MPPTGEALGVALLCDSQGIVVRVLHDDLGVGDAVSPGQPWSAIVDRGSLRKALNFLVRLRERGAIFEWEMNVPHAGHVTTLHFVGVELEEYLLIVGAKSSNGVMVLYEEMMRIGNEQVNALRRIAKERSQRDRDAAREARDGEVYDELTRLNNELVAMQRELARKNAELERLNEQKNELLGMAAHDLRNPLHAIVNYSGFLLEDASEVLTAEQLEFLSIIQSSTEFMVTLVNDLLDVARIESGKLELKRSATDLAALVEQNVALNRPLAGSKDIDLRVSVEPTPKIFVDPAKMGQVLDNLLSNAIKYSPPETVVDVDVRGDADWVVLSVQDRGQGIPEDEIDVLFRPFETTSVRATAGEKSTGLGLVIIKRIIEGHGGEIEVDSAVGEGSTFTARLPVISGGAAANEPG